MTATLMMLAAAAVFGPSGEKVCDVTLPALPQGARIETANLENAVAWRIRFDGVGERRITDEGWVFDFGADLRCWPVSHAQGEYVPKTLSTISQMRPRPDFAPVAAGIGEMHNYATHFPGTAESPLVVEGPGFVAAIGDAGCLDYARIRFASGEKPGTVKTILEGEAKVKAPYVTPWRYIHVAKDAAALANAQPALMDALNAPSRIADTSWIKPGKVLRVAKLDTDCGKAAVESVPVAPTMTIPAAARGGFAAIFEQKAVTDCYWHWMNGNVSREGITADLEYMKSAGIDAAMIFDVGIGAKRGKVDYASDEWKDCVAWASREAERLGMELSLHNSPGYSACGGPWIKPEESMKQLVWHVEKNSSLTGLTGLTGFGTDNNLVNLVNPVKNNFYREIARYPLATADETIDVSRRLEKGESVEIALDGEKEVAALNVWRGEREKPLDPFDGPRDYGCTLKAEVFDGAAWHAVGDVRCPTLRARDVPGFLRLKSPARATRLRLTSNRGANLARIEVISTTPAEGRELVIGYTSTGQTVTAAPDSGLGLECDKFSRRGVDAHFDRHLDPLFANCGKGAIRYLVIDSWEAGKQDWTDDFAAKFKARCGYDCIPYLPVLTGRNVLRGRIHASALDKEQSQGQLKFTLDYEATKKHLFETEFLAPFAERAHKLGLLVAGEPYGDGDFDMETFVKYLDLPMSEYWAKSHYGSIERPMRVNAAAKACGKTYVGCEAFTAFPGDADIAPTLENFAEAIDLLKSAGVKRFVFHSIVHQPSDDSALTMGPFGTRFDRAHCTPSALRQITDYIKQR